MVERGPGRGAAQSDHGTRDAVPPKGSGTDEPWRVTVHDDPAEIDPLVWNRLLQSGDAPTVFERHEWLAALHHSGSATEASGWSPRFLLAHRGGRPEGALALYRKSHSWGEYVFDWAWAQAYEAHGQRYFPKLVGAVPFTPVPGSRLLTATDEGRRILLDAAVALAREEHCSSVHLLFPSPADREAARAAGWMLREGVQFHWSNRRPTPYVDFNDFLGALHREKRKKITQERRIVRDAGISFETLEGEAIGLEDWRFFHQCYERTYAEHRSTPYLSLECFVRAGRSLTSHWVLFVARRGSERMAASLLAIDPDRRVAYGRYWGALESVRCLHFEACYYQPLQWCIERGFERFEGGAQGEHKMARGLLPVPTWSAHWLADARFARAVEHYLAQERGGVDGYLDELGERSPFRADAASAPPPRPD